MEIVQVTATGSYNDRVRTGNPATNEKYGERMVNGAMTRAKAGGVPANGISRVGVNPS